MLRDGHATSCPGEIAEYCNKDRLEGKEKSLAGTMPARHSSRVKIVHAGSARADGSGHSDNRSLPQASFKDNENIRIKLTAGKLFHDLEHRFGRHAFPVWPVGGHGIV
jgi:hypothetical protein